MSTAVVAVDRPMESAGIWSRQYLRITLANVLVIGLAAFDALAVVAALPSMAEELGFVVLLPWVITGYIATSGVAGIVAGQLIDAIGVRPLFRFAGLWFIAANAAAAVAPSMPLLVLARVGQGVGAGLMFAITGSVIGLAYPHALRPRAFAANSMAWGVLGLGSPAFAGVLLAATSWRVVFLIPIPLTVLALAIGWNALPAPPTRSRPIGLDWRGTIILAGMLGTSLLAVGQIGIRWWAAGLSAAMAVALGGIYWSYSGRVEHAVLAREHLARVPLRWIHITAGLALMAGLAVNNYLPLYIQTTRGRSVGFAAFSLVFLTVGWTAGSISYSTLLSRWREPEVVLLGAALLVPSIAMATITIAVDGAFTFIFGSFALIGLSLGLVTTASLTAILSVSAQSEIGRVNAAHQFATTLGLTYGVALGGSVVLFVVSQLVGDVETIRGAIAGDDLVLGADTNDAIGRGLAWATATALIVSVAALFASTRLCRHCFRLFRSMLGEDNETHALQTPEATLTGSAIAGRYVCSLSTADAPALDRHLQPDRDPAVVPE